MQTLYWLLNLAKKFSYPHYNVINLNSFIYETSNDARNKKIINWLEILQFWSNLFLNFYVTVKGSLYKILVVYTFGSLLGRCLNIELEEKDIIYLGWIKLQFNNV